MAFEAVGLEGRMTGSGSAVFAQMLDDALTSGSVPDALAESEHAAIWLLIPCRAGLPATVNGWSVKI
jgi:hypothetical protein